MRNNRKVFFTGLCRPTYINNCVLKSKCIACASIKTSNTTTLIMTYSYAYLTVPWNRCCLTALEFLGRSLKTQWLLACYTYQPASICLVKETILYSFVQATTWMKLHLSLYGFVPVWNSQGHEVFLYTDMTEWWSFGRWRYQYPWWTF